MRVTIEIDTSQEPDAVKGVVYGNDALRALDEYREWLEAEIESRQGSDAAVLRQCRDALIAAMEKETDHVAR